MAIPTNLKTIFQSKFDELIAGFGKNVILYFELKITSSNQVGFDNIRNAPGKPQYKEDKPTIVTTTKTIVALQKWNPKNLEDFGINLQKPTTVLRLKTKITEIDDLKRASYIVPSADVSNKIGAKFKLMIEPIPFGLVEDKYVMSFWERV